MRFLVSTIFGSIALAASALAQSGLPQNLPSGLPADLVTSPFMADFVWVEQWGTNGAWSNRGLWRTGAQVGEEVNNDNSVLLNNRAIYRSELQTLPIPAGSPPNQAGISVWVGTPRWFLESPDQMGGNDNVDVVQNFTLGSLTVQNASQIERGRSFRDGGTLILNSGVAGRPARVVHLGDESSNGDDMNIRGGTSMRLDSPTEFFLLNTQSRFRVRDNSRIFGTGDLILNPGNPFSFAGEATGQGERIRRELRVENTGRIATTGNIHIHAARLRLIGSSDITDTQSIVINPQGQLMLERPGSVTFNLGNGPLRLNSGGHLMDDGSNGALRQESNAPADVAIVNNAIEIVGSSALHVRGEGTLELRGPISGVSGGQFFGEAVELRKTGSGLLRLLGSQSSADSWQGGWNITNGTVELAGDSRLPFAPLRFGSVENERRLQLNAGEHRVTLLDGDAMDPDEVDTVNTLDLHLGSAATVLRIEQAIQFDGEEETDTRFQGDISGPGSLVKAGDGMLRLTRWAKTFSGETRIEQGVLAVSESAALANTSQISVAPGGQLRLTSSGPDVRYNFGGELVLAGSGRSGNISEGEGQGVSGALRLDPGSTATTTSIASPVRLAEAAGIHVNGADKTLILQGALTGPGQLNRSGAGALFIRGTTDLSGGIVLENGLTVFESGALLGRGDIQFIGTTNNSTLDLSGGVHTARSLSGGSAASSVLLRAGTTLTLTASSSGRPPFAGSVSGGGILRYDGVGNLQLPGLITGLERLEVLRGGIYLPNGASQIGLLRLAQGTTAQLMGAFSGTNVEWAGTLRPFFGAPPAIGGNLTVVSGAAVDIRSFEGNLQPGTHQLLSVAGTVTGWDQVQLLSDRMDTALVLENGSIAVRITTPSISDEQALTAAIGPVQTMGGNVYVSEWLGEFISQDFATGNRWIRPSGQTWWYVVGDASHGGGWFYDIVLGYLWTGSAVYPFIFDATGDNWLFFGGSVATGRAFFDYHPDVNAWITVAVNPWITAGAQ